MKRKLKFMQAVRILAPDDQFIHQAAERVREGALPAFPGGAALEFVAAMEKLRGSPFEAGPHGSWHAPGAAESPSLREAKQQAPGLRDEMSCQSHAE